MWIIKTIHLSELWKKHKFYWYAYEMENKKRPMLQNTFAWSLRWHFLWETHCNVTKVKDIVFISQHILSQISKRGMSRPSQTKYSFSQIMYVLHNLWTPFVDLSMAHALYQNIIIVCNISLNLKNCNQKSGSLSTENCLGKIYIS